MMDTYRARHGIRDVGAALGLPPGEVDALAKAFPHIRASQVRAAMLDLPELPVAATYTDADVAPSGSADDDGPAHAAVAPAAPDRLTGRWWKFDAVRRLVRADPSRPIVWLDDDLAAEADVRDWMHAHTTCLLVAPEPRSGLTPDQLADVADFLKRSSAA